MTALGVHPAEKPAQEKNNASALAKPMRALGTRIRIFFEVNSPSTGDGGSGALLGAGRNNRVLREGQVARLGAVGWAKVFMTTEASPKTSP